MLDTIPCFSYSNFIVLVIVIIIIIKMSLKLYYYIFDLAYLVLVYF